MLFNTTSTSTAVSERSADRALGGRRRGPDCWRQNCMICACFTPRLHQYHHPRGGCPETLGIACLVVPADRAIAVSPLPAVSGPQRRTYNTPHDPQPTSRPGFAAARLVGQLAQPDHYGAWRTDVSRRDGRPLRLGHDRPRMAAIFRQPSGGYDLGHGWLGAAEHIVLKLGEFRRQATPRQKRN